jgi:hypothetical protein
MRWLTVARPRKAASCARIEKDLLGGKRASGQRQTTQSIIAVDTVFADISRVNCAKDAAGGTAIRRTSGKTVCPLNRSKASTSVSALGEDGQAFPGTPFAAIDKRPGALPGRRCGGAMTIV